MKKTICVILVIVLIFALHPFVYAAGTTNSGLLSELTDDECIAFLKSSGVEIPALFEEESTWAVFIRSTIEQVEENPHVSFPYGYTVLANFANDIKRAVNEYYGSTQMTQYNLPRSTNILKDNVVCGSWNDSYLNYTCYAYAIGDTVMRDPGQYYWISMGNSASTYIYIDNASISTIASWIEDDLESLGYTVGSVTTTNPNTNVNGHTKLICVRKDNNTVLAGYDQNGNAVYIYDYHLMKLNADGYWYHKPGDTNPLRYKYTPTNSRIWVSEGYKGAENTYFRYEDFTYDSAIYFIEYTTPHDYEHKYCGSGQHIKTCTICQATTGIASNCIYVNGRCKVCKGYQTITTSLGKYSSIALAE